jgi:hypothetical protein
MSFVTSIRDYVEFVNNISDSLGGQISFTKFFSETFIYFGKTLQYGLIYIFSFQWLRDFTLLPIIVPQIANSIFKETFFLESPSQVFFNILDIPSIGQNKFFVGLLNSLFLTLPFSVSHIISIRRLYIKGIPAGVFSIGGYLTGQLLFIACVIFGLRSILVPWLTLEPLNYFIGFVLVFRIIYSMTQENLRELSYTKGDFWNRNQPQYRTFFITSFMLAWCEQTSLFQYLGNLTITSTPTILETVSSSDTLPFPNGTFGTERLGTGTTGTVLIELFNHSSYILGIAAGLVIFTVFWGWFFLQLKNWCINYTPLFLSSFIQSINKTSFVLAVGFTLSSIPFYGLDYLTTNPLGFISQDKVFKNTLLDQYNVKDSIGVLSMFTNFESVELDVSPFDRGRYLLYPSTQSGPLSFEDLNYKGEAEWTTREEKRSTITDSRAGFFTLAKLFKKQSSEQLPTTRRSEENSEQIFPLRSKFSVDTSPLDSPGDFQSTESRFMDWYTLNPVDDEAGLENTFVDFQNRTFPLDFLRVQSTEKGLIDLKIKQKYYSNPIYKNLLAADIDLFLNRQPENFRLSGENELDLYTKRRMLSSYYDSLRSYSKLPYSQDFENFFDGSKSFSNKVYNQQFKGTLRSVSRLFSLTVDPTYTENVKNRETALLKNNKTRFSNKTLETEQETLQVLKFDQPLYEFSTSPFSAYHEEIQPPIKKQIFLQENVSGPLYAGWDEKLRKFVITNKILPRNLASYKAKIIPELTKQAKRTWIIKNEFGSNSSSSVVTFPLPKDTLGTRIFGTETETQKIRFTAWPLSNETLARGKSDSSIPYVTLYELKTDPRYQNPNDQQIFGLLSTLPSNLQTLQNPSAINLFDSLAPQRGGFIWPGNSKIQIKSFNK